MTASRFDDIPRQLEHFRSVGLRCVQSQIGIGAGTEMPFLFQTRDSRRSRACQDADLATT